MELHSHPTPNCKKEYKHSMSECAVKLNGIKYLLNEITLSIHDSDSKHMAESAKVLCDELIRELKVNLD